LRGGNGGHSQNLGVGRSRAEGGLEAAHGIPVSVGVGLHIPVFVVCDPSDEAQLVRLPQDEIAEPHALDPSRHAPRPRYEVLHAISVTITASPREGRRRKRHPAYRNASLPSRPSGMPNRMEACYN